MVRSVSEETRLKISRSLTGKQQSPETIAKRAVKLRGKVHSEQAKAKMSASKRGHPTSPETRAKIAASLAGKPSANKGRVHTLESRAHMAAGQRGRTSPNKGKPVPPDTKAKISAKLTGRKLPHDVCEKIGNAVRGHFVSQSTREKISEANRGERSGNWRGGTTFEPYCPKFNSHLKRRVRAFFNNRCAICGLSTEENGRTLSVHHVNYDKWACCDDVQAEFAPLCFRCHGFTGKDRGRWEAMLHRIIDEIYGGKSYYTKEEWKNLMGC